MKKTTLAALVALGLFTALSITAFARPGEGQGKGGEPEYFGQEQAGGHCGAMAAEDGAKGGCGCGHMDAAAGEATGAGKGCACGPDCKCGCAQGGECKCGAMMGGEGGCKCGAEGGCNCGAEGGCKCGHMEGAGHHGCGMMMGEEGKGCGCGMGEGHHKGHHGKKGGHKFWKCPKASAELSLTDEQKQKLEAMDTESEKKAEAIHAEIKAMKDQMKALFDAEPINVDAVRALAGQIGAKKAEKKALHMVQKAEAMNVLTAEQRGKLKELHQKMKDGNGPMGQDDADIKCPKAMEEKAAHLEKKAKELDGKSKELKARAKALKDKAKKAKAKSGKGKK